MPVTHSMTLVTTAADRPAANAYFDGLGWGEEVLVVRLSPDGQLPITHYAAHDMRTAEVVATLQAAQASDDPILDAIDGLFIYPVESETAQFAAAIQSAEIVTAFGSTLQIYSPSVDP